MRPAWTNAVKTHRVRTSFWWWWLTDWYSDRLDFHSYTTKSISTVFVLCRHILILYLTHVLSTCGLERDWITDLPIKWLNSTTSAVSLLSSRILQLSPSHFFNLMKFSINGRGKVIRRRHRRGLFGLFHCSLNENDPTSHLLYDLGKNFPGEFMVSGVVSSLFLVQLRCTVVIYDLYHNHNAATI